MADYDIAITYKKPEKDTDILHISAEPGTLVKVIEGCECFADKHFKDINALTVYNSSKPVPEKNPTGTQPEPQPAP